MRPRAPQPPPARHRSGACMRIVRERLSNAALRRVLHTRAPPALVAVCNYCCASPEHTGAREPFDAAAIHEVSCIANGATSLVDSGIADLAQHSRALTNCYIYERGLHSPSDTAHFARALRSSSLRTLFLGELSAGSACAFLENLPPSRMRDLSLSVPDMSAAEEAHVVRCIARLLADPQRSGTLARLSIQLSHAAHAALAHVLHGSPTQRPNVSLLALEPCDAGCCETVRQRNCRIHQCTRREAVHLLCAARIICCRARVVDGASAACPFFTLPAELRMHVLGMLAPHLSQTQITDVLSWACCAATIGHCCRRRADPRPPMDATLAVPPWTWDNCASDGRHAPDLTGWDGARDSMPFLESTGTSVPFVDAWY